MKWVKDDISINFMSARVKAFCLSAVLILGSFITLFTQGLNLGIDFKGGSAIIASFQADAQIDRAELANEIASLITEELGQQEAGQVSVQDFSAGGGGESGKSRYLIYTEMTSLISGDKRNAIKDALQKKYGEGTRIDVPKEGADVFYVNFKDPADINQRRTELDAFFKTQGFEQIRVVSDQSNRLDIMHFKQLDMLISELRDAADKEKAQREIEVLKGSWSAEKTQRLKDLKDKRFTVTVEELKGKVTKRLSGKYGPKFVAVESSTSVSPSVGRDLFENGLLAVLYAIIGILIYITVRFDVRYAPGAVVALVHDVIITMGIFSLFQIKFSLPIIAALLTIVGYSLNDTIVVMDRVRETFDQFRGRSVIELLNKAINNTLSRTLLTSVTTALVILAILVLGGGLIQDFALALIIGVLFGTYSSIYVASPLVYYMDQYLSRREKLSSSRG